MLNTVAPGRQAGARYVVWRGSQSIDDGTECIFLETFMNSLSPTMARFMKVGTALRGQTLIQLNLEREEELIELWEVVREALTANSMEPDLPSRIWMAGNSLSLEHARA